MAEEVVVAVVATAASSYTGAGVAERDEVKVWAFALPGSWDRLLRDLVESQRLDWVLIPMQVNRQSVPDWPDEIPVRRSL